jgi:hypothetical protein
MTVGGSSLRQLALVQATFICVPVDRAVDGVHALALRAITAAAKIVWVCI